MQHQYWVTKKSVLRKLGGREDECIISSDAELDAKLELFKSINDSCNQLQRVIDLYQERLCYLAQEENALGRYLKDCGKNEKNSCAGQIMAISGKALAFTGHQRLTVRPPLIRLHHEVETFRGRAVTDTRATVSEMEKTRTEYRAALSWMKSVSDELDPDSGSGLERFRKAQSYVKSAKSKFDILTLTCLQKIDLLAAARCNMFSHALVSYQTVISTLASKAADTLRAAATKLDNLQPLDNSSILDLAANMDNDKDRKTFFNAEYLDNSSLKKETDEKNSEREEEEIEQSAVGNLLNEDFAVSDINEGLVTKSEDVKPNSALLDLTWINQSDFLGGDFMPSKLIQEGSFNFREPSPNKDDANSKKTTENEARMTNEKQMSWLSLFAELDPLANSTSDGTSGDRA